MTLYYRANLNFMSIGEIHRDHSGTENPVWEINHLSLHTGNENTYNIIIGNSQQSIL